MAAEKQEFTEHDLQGLKHFRSLRKLLVRLHGVGASHDTAGNRELSMDQYCVLVLVCLLSTQQQRQLRASWKLAATGDPPGQVEDLPPRRTARAVPNRIAILATLTGGGPFVS